MQESTKSDIVGHVSVEQWQYTAHLNMSKNNLLPTSEQFPYLPEELHVCLKYELHLLSHGLL